MANPSQSSQNSGLRISPRDDDVIQPWDSDHTALIHVLWDVKRAGLTVEHNADEIASRIMRSKWMRAVRLHAKERGS